MSANPARVRATPFHSRAAAANEANAWVTRGGFTLARDYAGTQDEALAARFRVGLIDLSWRWRVMLEGARAEDFASCLLTANAAVLAPGTSLKAAWLSDGGGVRGTGLLARYGRESFQLVSAASDAAWIADAAARFDVGVNDVTEAEGGLALAGPYAAATLSRAGLDPDMEPLSFKRQFWRGLDITLSRWGELGGYELWCKSDDALILWDRLMRAGEPFGIEPLGLAAADILDLEAGIARPLRDWDPAQDGEAVTPSPRALGLEGLIADGHTDFNGRNGWLAARDGEMFRLAGLLIEADEAAPFTPVTWQGRSVGHTLSSARSPAMRRAIAFARLEAASAEPGTRLNLTLSPTKDMPEFRTVAAQVSALPFLPSPDPITP